MDDVSKAQGKRAKRCLLNSLPAAVLAPRAHSGACRPLPFGLRFFAVSETFRKFLALDEQWNIPDKKQLHNQWFSSVRRLFLFLFALSSHTAASPRPAAILWLVGRAKGFASAGSKESFSFPSGGELLLSCWGQTSSSLARPSAFVCPAHPTSAKI